MKLIMLIMIISLILISGCNTLDEDCGKKYDIDDCNFPKCMYENSEGYTVKYRAQLLDAYYECKSMNLLDSEDIK